MQDRSRSGALKCHAPAEELGSATVQILVEGSPEVVQRIADAIEMAMPEFIEWNDDAAAECTAGRLCLKGAGAYSFL